MIFLILAISNDIELNPGPADVVKSLNACHVNIRSLSRAKLRAIQCSLANIYDVITVSETHLHPGLPDNAFALSGYHDIIRKDRNAQGGGVAIYIKNTICFKRLYQIETDDLEAIWVQLNTIEGKIALCCTYRPPDKAGGPPPMQFWHKLESAIDHVKGSSVKYMFILETLMLIFRL